MGQAAAARTGGTPRSTTSAGAPRSNDAAISSSRNTSRPSSPKSRRRPARRLPEFVKDEFDAFLECGILAHGFLRLRCADCAMRSWWRFRASGAGFARHAGRGAWRRRPRTWSITSSRRVPVRQWVLSFPIPLRTLLAAHPQLLSAVLQIVHRVVATFAGRGEFPTPTLWANAHGFSLHAAVRCGADQRNELEQL